MSRAPLPRTQRLQPLRPLLDGRRSLRDCMMKQFSLTALMRATIQEAEGGCPPTRLMGKIR